MSKVLRPSIKPFISMLLVLLGLSACDGTLEVGIERTATPAQAIPTPTPWLTPTPYMDHWVAYSNPVFAVSLEYPVNWQPVPETDGTKFVGDNGFFQVGAMDADSLDQVAASEAGHVLQPYGSQPIIETLQIQGQEARLIMPSGDQPAGMNYQAALIVHYPQPVNVSGTPCRYFVLWSDHPHIRTIAQTLQFSADPAPAATATPAPPVTWENLPPGLVFSTSEGLWVVQGDERATLVHDNAQAVLSPDGTQLLSYDAAQQDLWLLDLAQGAIWNLTKRPDRAECCFQWWPQRPDVVLFSSTARDVESAPGSMGYLSTVGMDGQNYQVLDAEHDTGLGGFAPSPDGQTIAYGDGSAGWLYRWGGSEVFDPWDYGLIVRDGVEIAHPAWSPDGARLAWLVKANLAVDGSLRAGVGVFDVEARTARVLHPYAPQGVGWPATPAWSPDGQWLAFSDSSASDQAGLWVVRTEGLWEEHHLGLGGNPVWSPDGKWLAFQSFAQDGPASYVLVEAGTWALRPLDLPVDRYGMLVDWINVTSPLAALATTTSPPQAATVSPYAIDETLHARASAVLQALKTQDMSALAAYLHPLGVRFSPSATVMETHQVFMPAQIPELYYDATVYEWGTYTGSGLPIELPFAAYYASFVYDHDYVNAVAVGYNERLGEGNAIDNSLEFYAEAVVLEYHFPGFDPAFAGMDWASLRLVFQQVDGEWYLAGVIHDSWTI